MTPPAGTRRGRARTACIAGVLAVSTALSACFNTIAAGPFSTALGSLLRAQRPARVDLAKVLPLQWDELFLYGPYSPREPACRELGLGWLPCRTTLPATTDEGAWSLVFRLNGRVVHHEQHARRNGDFAPVGEGPRPVRRGAAVFDVEARAAAAGGGWVLRPAR